MDLLSSSSASYTLTLVLTLSLLTKCVFGATFTFNNKCEYTVWPGILANAGSPSLSTTGFELPESSSRSFQAPTGWSGRFWGRTGCNFDGSGSGSCQTGDCGSNQVECNGAGAAPPATLAEFTLGTGGSDFYDVSLVDGYNIAMIVEVSGGTGLCATTGCVNDLNQQCPSELRTESGMGCKSACEAFGSAEYCCSGAYNTPATCKPSVYSEMFKSFCPRSYSYAYDDPTSTFTCVGADYTVTFCPSMPSQKASRDTSPPAADTTDGTTNTTPSSGDEALSGSGAETGYGYGSLSGSGTTSGSGSESETGSGSLPEAGTGSGSEALEANGSWLAGLAMGGSARSEPFGATTLPLFLFVLFFL
ncbi:pathogenesis-related thaumatin superfamily protein [Artemisia annua]|uniref:Pathogenesis-related thaumatin superfamily protein n=1 Tax=Artemisia annua TaxID=35608 RepID=A0A2U1KDL9_ARTAN|nr:pathogenesis-related thaumatin superfamily protein [Artemisia annua]